MKTFDDYLNGYMQALEAEGVKSYDLLPNRLGFVAGACAVFYGIQQSLAELSDEEAMPMLNLLHEQLSREMAKARDTADKARAARVESKEKGEPATKPTPRELADLAADLLGHLLPAGSVFMLLLVTGKDMNHLQYVSNGERPVMMELLEQLLDQEAMMQAADTSKAH